MNIDPLSLKTTQPSLFNFLEDSVGAVELFPAVWNAAEDITSPDLAVRQAALDRLVSLRAPRLSPLIAYLLSTRLGDTDIAFRTRIVRVLGEIFLPDEQGRSAPEVVTRHLSWNLSQMHNRIIFALLQVANNDPSSVTHVARLMNACPYGGNHLASILADRKIPMPVRKQAANMIGLVGYLDVIPALERMAARTEARLNGQQTMSFAPLTTPDETELLPVVQKALEILYNL